MARPEPQIDPKFLDGPIPGMSLTTEPGNRPWENPPQFTTVQEAADFYTQRILEEDTQDLVVAALDQGLSVDVITEHLTTAAVMEGYHSIDVAVLAMPIVRELIMYIGDANDIEYVVSYKDMQKAKRIPYKMAKEIAAEVTQAEPKEEAITAKKKPGSFGLMARRGAI